MDMLLHFLIGMGVCFLFLQAYVWLTAPRISQEEIDQLVQDIRNSIVSCRVEKENDVYYLYETASDVFVGQGTSAADLVEISDRLEKHIVIVDGNEDVVEELKNMNMKFNQA